ncbi:MULTISPECIES: type II toxin-antitoxin system VapC family toxin [Cyanophyceae]|uniref:type II toxin-antitoxin system VapC family toxin n=1 Tax=Cyanophyceae TaxID=3028117 RepID=UPI00232D998E|nr:MULTISPECIES: type II toxin-antitoxin system VapC family toxin [Cyanophyceae]MDB9357811.1 type II toxin-antitoxin system VapC family toxin [Nodularia spumigena CS-587/03]MDB9306247.1 type II toxin-antitoxin system VapC family toxin [Nodularia spumigena CS-591/12]MDB9337843.1 type II toxin-antitoxin system VapC family toxin [Nodularia spumigena CS-589/07]MDB9401581.1 type II toxin-antitoxin system VapC family toxin [Microcystis aeruginosa CS-567/02-A1]MDB9499187.1 type II toxin-antitoxin sys
MNYLLDTNIVSAILKNNPKVIKPLDKIRIQGEKVFISRMTYYEIKRGYLAVKAHRKLLNFENFCDEYFVLLLDDMAIFNKATEIHADLKIRGLPIQDVDVFIAATAMIHNLILVSHDSDLLRIPNLKLEDWLQG